MVGEIGQSVLSKWGPEVWGKSLSQHTEWLNLGEPQDTACYEANQHIRGNTGILSTEAHVAHVGIWSSQQITAPLQVEPETHEKVPLAQRVTQRRNSIKDPMRKAGKNPALNQESYRTFS